MLIPRTSPPLRVRPHCSSGPMISADSTTLAYDLEYGTPERLRQSGGFRRPPQPTALVPQRSFDTNSGRLPRSWDEDTCACTGRGPDVYNRRLPGSKQPVPWMWPPINWAGQRTAQKKHGPEKKRPVENGPRKNGAEKKVQKKTVQKKRSRESGQRKRPRAEGPCSARY